MTIPQPDNAPIPAVDPGNLFVLRDYPTSYSAVVTDDRKRLVLTFRTGPATVTILLPKEQLGELLASLTTLRGHMTDLIIPDMNGRGFKLPPL